MYTFGSIVLAIIGVAIMQVLMGLLGGLLGGAIASTTGVIWIPVLIMAALNSCAVYAGVYFALKVVPSGNAKTTSLFVLGIIFLSTLASAYSSIVKDESGLALGLTALILNSLAEAFGCWIAYLHIISEREEPAIEEAD